MGGGREKKEKNLGLFPKKILRATKKKNMAPISQGVEIKQIRPICENVNDGNDKNKQNKNIFLLELANI